MIKTTDIINDIKKIPALSKAVLDVVTLIDNGKSDVAMIELELSQDPVLTAKVLRVANSPFYGLQGKVVSIRDACVVLGMASLKNIVMAAGVMNTMGASSAANSRRNKLLWEHMLVTGIAARKIAVRIDEEESSAFAAGLFHDLGRLVLSMNYPEDYAHVMSRASRDNLQIIEAENELLGIDHEMVGNVLLEHWRLPELLRTAISYHHRPDHKDASTLSVIVHFADVMARALGIGQDFPYKIQPLSEAVFQRFALSWDVVEAILYETEHEYNDSRGFLN